MSNISKRRREGSRTKIKSMGDHKEFLKRITKTLYYGHLPTLPCLSLPLTELSCSVWSETQRGRSLRRLHADAAARVARGACVSPCALVLALLYLERLNACNPDYLLGAAPQDLFLISLMVGNKFLQDDGEDDEVISAEWAASGGIDLKQLNKLELQFLDAIDWNIFVSEESFEAGLARLERQVALRQGGARGFYTYAELAAAGDGALAAAGARALAAACLALGAAVATLAALLASALLVAHACQPARAALRDLSPAAYEPALPTLPSNATVELTIDALADELQAHERLRCCAEGGAAQAGWRRARALRRLRWAALTSPVQRWLERVAEYAALLAGSPPAPCAPRWLDLSRLSALLVTVSDR